jgi:hypothetical protein
MKMGHPVSLDEYHKYQNRPERGGWKALNYTIDKGLCQTYTVLFSLVFITTTSTALTVAGIVYNDVNKNGKHDGREKGIKGVAVSNGVSVTKTDRKGRYKIALEENSTLFISKPSGYALRLDGHNLPIFYFHYYPDGSPKVMNLQYPGLEPTAPIDNDINFALYKHEEPKNYDVIWVSDPQTTSNEEVSYFRDRIVNEITGTKAALGVTTGDIMNDDLSLFPRYIRIMAQAGIPWFNLPGNHDMNYMARDDTHSLDTYKRYFGPAYYSFNYGDVHYVLLDSIIYDGTDPENPDKRPEYTGGIDEKQLAWLKADLSILPRDTALLLAMHIPLKINSPDIPAFSVQNRNDVYKILEGFENILVIAGHWHSTQHMYLGPADGFNGKTPIHQHVITTAAGYWWNGIKDIYGIPHTIQGDGTPNGYHVMSVNGHKLKMRYKAAGKSPDYQMRIMLETMPEKNLVSILPVSLTSSTNILVNVFDGGPNTTVSCRLDENEPVMMTPVLREDPFTFARYVEDGLFEPQQESLSSHIWSLPMQRDIAPGVHTLFINVKDEYGQTHMGSKIFEVEFEE